MLLKMSFLTWEGFDVGRFAIGGGVVFPGWRINALVSLMM